MKTMNIFKTLALAMLMPTMLLTTACSSEDDLTNNTVNSQPVAKKGYALPVTVNVSRQGDKGSNRASYNESTRKLEFSPGDKLYVEGSHIDADRFAGTLDYDAGSGKFSGTIYTESPYEGTIDDLLNGNYATLLPAGYKSYDYLEIMDEGYEAHLGENAYNSFATSKKLGVEQLSYETGSYTSGTGFVLEPRNAILNFTITGLTASTNVTATLSDDDDWTPDIEGEVTTDGSGNATFAIGLEGSSDLKDFSLTVAGNAITLVSSSTPLAAGKIYNINRSATPVVALEFVTFTFGTNTVKVATMNLGATSVADGTSCYGDYYAWGATETFGTVAYTAYNAGTVTPTTGHIGGYSQANAPYYENDAYIKYTSASDATLEAADDAVAVNMPGCHMPTQAELQTLYAACGGTGTSMTPPSISDGAAYEQGIYWVEGATSSITIGGDEYKANGVLFVQDATHHVFFPATGNVNGTTLYSAGSAGNYWYSSLRTENISNAYRLNFSKSFFGNRVDTGSFSFRYYGFPVRPFKD